jgi:hypothetical protein
MPAGPYDPGEQGDPLHAEAPAEGGAPSKHPGTRGKSTYSMIKQAPVKREQRGEASVKPVPTLHVQ